jgi:hypothetical protein
MQEAVNTFGGFPALVSRSAISALIALTRRHPPTVDPGATGSSSPSMETMASPRGAPVSRTRSAKSLSFLPSSRFDSLASECSRLIKATTRTPLRWNSSAISTGTMLVPEEEMTSALS